MTQKRQTTLKYTLLTAAAGLIIICWLVLVGACWPAAPAEQTATSTDETLQTPTHTNTPTLQAEASPLVNAVMVKQATVTADAAGAVSGQSAPTRPQTIDVNIYTVDEPRNDVERFLIDNGVSVHHKRDCGEECLMLNAVIPVSLLQYLSRHPSVDFIDSIEKYYERLDMHLNPIVAQYDAGLITEQEAVAQSYLPRWENRILVVVDFDSPANNQSAIAYLDSNNVYLAPQYIGAKNFAGLVPFRLILPLSQQPGAVSVVGYGYGADLTDPGLQEELNEYKSPQPASDAVVDTGVSGAAQARGTIVTPQPKVVSGATPK